MIGSAEPSISPLLLAIESNEIKLLLFVLFLLIGGFGKLMEALAEHTKRKRELERRAQNRTTTTSSSGNATPMTSQRRELRAGPMAQTELEERLRQMLGRDAGGPLPNRAGSPTPTAARSTFAGAPATRSLPPLESKSQASAKATLRNLPRLETADTARRSREHVDSKTRRITRIGVGVPTAARAAAVRDARRLLRGGPASLRQAFILSEVLNRKHD